MDNGDGDKWRPSGLLQIYSMLRAPTDSRIASAQVNFFFCNSRGTGPIKLLYKSNVTQITSELANFSSNKRY